MPVAAAKSALTSHLNGLRRSAMWLEGYSGLIVGVSGGPDSLALALVAADICTEQKIRFEAVIINHGLREEATSEADQVAEMLKRRGIRSCCLSVTAPAPAAGRLAWARLHRLQLLCDYARQTASAVLFAHHFDDQAETVAMRLARGSALRGLSAIAPVRLYQGVLFSRPFLGLRKADLIAVCAAYEADYIMDPSNIDQAFERVRVRACLQRPEHRELRQKLVQLASLSRRLSARLSELCDKWCAEHTIFTFRLRSKINRVAFSKLNNGAQNFILRHCLAVIGGQPYPVSDDRLERIRARLATGTRSTAGGCVIQVSAESITIIAEFGRLPEPELIAQAGRVYRFDRRWLIRAPEDGVIRRLGPAGWAKCRQVSNFQPVSVWTARMGAMIPVFHGLDGKIYCPHFISYRDFYFTALPVSAYREVPTGTFSAMDLPVDEAVELEESHFNDG